MITVTKGTYSNIHDTSVTYVGLILLWEAVQVLSYAQLMNNVKKDSINSVLFNTAIFKAIAFLLSCEYSLPWFLTTKLTLVSI